MLNRNQRLSATASSAAPPVRNLQASSVAANIHFAPDIPQSIASVCWLACQHFKGFHPNYAFLTASVASVTDRIAARASTKINEHTRQQFIVLNLSDNLNLSIPENAARITYVMLHEIFIHASPNSWDFANVPNYSSLSDQEHAQISDRHHINMFCNGERGYFHSLVKSMLQYQQSPSCRQSYINAYVSDIAIYIEKLTSTGALHGQEKIDAGLWLSQLMMESNSIYSHFWQR